MFRNPEEVGNLSQLNKSAVRGIRSKLLALSPIMERIVDNVIPKKGSLFSCKIRANEAKFEILSLNNEVLFVQQEKESLIFPHIKILH